MTHTFEWYHAQGRVNDLQPQLSLSTAEDIVHGMH